MATSASRRGFAGSIISAIVLLMISSHAVADTWSPITNTYFEDANQYYGAQLAVAEVRFLSKDDSIAVSTLLVAITSGSDSVMLYSFDTATDTLTFEDEIQVEVANIDEPIAWTPTFMDLDVVGTGDESCLVIPTIAEDTIPGSISIVRLTERVQGNQLDVLDNCFKCDSGDHRDVYHVVELPSSATEDYAISAAFTPVNDLANNVILLSSYDNDSRRFDDESTFTIPYIYYGSIHGTIDARTWVTFTEPLYSKGAAILSRILTASRSTVAFSSIRIIQWVS